MRRRLDLAMSLIARPQVIFLDEPTTGLDPRSRAAVWEAVQALADDGTTILLTTQYLEEADRLADRIAVVSDGRIAAARHRRTSSSRASARRPSSCSSPTRTRSRRPHALLGGGDAATGSACACPPTAPTTSAACSTPSTASPIDRLELHKPTLDDVFLALT